jgi:CRISPR system Cascade subunit CasA
VMSQRPRYDLRTEPWIAVTDLAGRPRMAGLREVFLSAHELRVVVDSSPLVVAALMRYLVAFGHRIVGGPIDEAAWATLRDVGRFEPDAVERYLDTVGDRLDLFDATHPFGQVTGLAERAKELASLARLVPERPGADKPVFFEHRLPAGGASPAEAARALVAWQTFALARAQAQWPGEPFRAAKDAPTARYAIIMVAAPTLYATLIANLEAYDPANGLPAGSTARDRPAWEREPLTGPGARRPDGLLDLLTWRSRAVEFVPVVEHGVVWVAGLVEFDGETCVALPEDLPDPFVALRARAKPREGESPWLRVELGRDRMAWRDSLALLGGTSTDAGRVRRPGILSFHAHLAELGYADAAGVLPVTVLGQATEPGQNKVHGTRRELLAPPVAALLDAEANRRDVVAIAIGMAEAGERALLRSGALNKLLEPEAASLPEMGPRTPARVRASVREAIEHFGGAGSYWSALDGSFRRLLLDLAAVAPGYVDILGRWRATVERAAGDTFEDALTAFPAQPFALAAGETIFRQALRRYLDVVAEGGT